MRRKIRVWDSVRHAQAQGLAQRIQCAAKLRVRHRADEKRRTNGSLGKKVIYNYIDSRCFKGKANGPLGKKGERPPIFTLGSECTGLRRALLLQREGERPLRKEGGTLANFYIGVEMYWLASCVASADGAVVVIRPSSKAKINEKPMKH